MAQLASSRQPEFQKGFILPNCLEDSVKDCFSNAQKIEEAVGKIVRLFEDRGDSAYGMEVVSQREHALQTAFLARQSGADLSLVVAALLHDVGHLLHNLPADAPEKGQDDQHEELGRRWLARWFDVDVLEPIRLHVAAKRYLCTVDPSYQERLSRPSLVSLALQGGPMSPEVIKAFEASPQHLAAIALRRWDDEAKVPHLQVPTIDDYRPDLKAVMTMAGVLKQYQEQG
jgi:phosphonate degradation associated HDIG domain protein